MHGASAPAMAPADGEHDGRGPEALSEEFPPTRPGKPGILRFFSLSRHFKNPERSYLWGEP